MKKMKKDVKSNNQRSEVKSNFEKKWKLKLIILLVCVLVIIISTFILKYFKHIHRYGYDIETQSLAYIEVTNDDITFEDNYIIIDNYSDYTKELQNCYELVVNKLTESFNSFENNGIEYIFDENFFEDNSLALIEIISSTQFEDTIINFEQTKDTANIKFYRRSLGSVRKDEKGTFIFLPISKETENVSIKYEYDITYEKEKKICYTVNIIAIIVIIGILIMVCIQKNKKINRGF